MYLQKLKSRLDLPFLSAESAKTIAQKVSTYIPQIINSTMVLLSNLIIMFFLLYYLLVQGRDMEKYLSKVIPLKDENVHLLAGETKMMIRANALGIPIICIVQGAFAALGYWIFGIEDWGLWGFVTGVLLSFR
ncbi:MAG: AI-2E family transporter [Chitinophagaceae bacterium]|nr:AI-2E family transporter [Chitinophagaceae bacterium]